MNWDEIKGRWRNFSSLIAIANVAIWTDSDAFSVMLFNLFRKETESTIGRVQLTAKKITVDESGRVFTYHMGIDAGAKET